MVPLRHIAIAAAASAAASLPILADDQKTGKLARPKSTKLAGPFCAAIERYDGGDTAETFQVVVRRRCPELAIGEL
jgi:hypothetical protein